MTEPQLTPFDQLELEFRARLVDLERRVQTLAMAVSALTLVLLLVLARRKAVK